ncbi:hypothetical protein AAY473_011490 [Plecturocebus cupreus]
MRPRRRLLPGRGRRVGGRGGERTGGPGSARTLPSGRPGGGLRGRGEAVRGWRGARPGRGANFPPATAGLKRAREARGPSGSALRDGAPGRSAGCGTRDTRGRRLGSRRGEVAPLQSQRQPRGSEARGVSALLARWTRTSRGCRARVARAARGQGTRSRRCTARSQPRRKALPGGALGWDPGREPGRSARAGSEPGRARSGRPSARRCGPGGWRPRVPGRPRLRPRSAAPAPTCPGAPALASLRGSRGVAGAQPLLGDPGSGLRGGGRRRPGFPHAAPRARRLALARVPRRTPGRAQATTAWTLPFLAGVAEGLRFLGGSTCCVSRFQSLRGMGSEELAGFERVADISESFKIKLEKGRVIPPYSPASTTVLIGNGQWNVL